MAGNDSTINQARAELRQAMSDYSNQLLALYKAKLQEGGINPSGNFASSLKTLSGEEGDDVFKGGLQIPEYGTYIEEGRKPGKFPPPDAIVKFIQERRITPQPYRLTGGKTVIPTQQQLAFLIGRKISKEGIPPRPYLQESIDELEGTLNDKISEIFTRLVEKQQNELPTLKI